MSQKHEKTILFAKNKLNHIDGLISKALIDSYLSHNKFVSMNDELREHNEMKEEIKNPEDVGSCNI